MGKWEMDSQTDRVASRGASTKDLKRNQCE